MPFGRKGKRREIEVHILLRRNRRRLLQGLDPPLKQSQCEAQGIAIVPANRRAHKGISEWSLPFQDRGVPEKTPPGAEDRYELVDHPVFRNLLIDRGAVAHAEAQWDAVVVTPA